MGISLRAQTLMWWNELAGNAVFAMQVVRELGRERAPQRLCDAILRFRVLTDDDFDVTKQGVTLSAESQHGR